MAKKKLTRRTYIYPNEFRPGEGMLQCIEHVAKIKGKGINTEPHFLITEDGKEHLISPGWINVSVEQEEEVPNDKK